MEDQTAAHAAGEFVGGLMVNVCLLAIFVIVAGSLFFGIRGLIRMFSKKPPQ